MIKTATTTKLRWIHSSWCRNLVQFLINAFNNFHVSMCELTFVNTWEIESFYWLIDKLKQLCLQLEMRGLANMSGCKHTRKSFGRASSNTISQTDPIDLAVRILSHQSGLYVCLPVYLSIHPSIHSSIHPSIHQSIHLPTNVPTYCYCNTHLPT